MQRGSVRHTLGISVGHIHKHIGALRRPRIHQTKGFYHGKEGNWKEENMLLTRQMGIWKGYYEMEEGDFGWSGALTGSDLSIDRCLVYDMFFGRRGSLCYCFSTVFVYPATFHPLCSPSVMASQLFCISGNKRMTSSSTTDTIRCLLMYESANRFKVSSTSCRINATSLVAKNFDRTYSGTTSTTTLAHSCLIVRVSSIVGGTLAGPGALSGKIAFRMACSADGRAAGSNRRLRIEWESNLWGETTSVKNPSRARNAVLAQENESERECVHMRGLIESVRLRLG